MRRYAISLALGCLGVSVIGAAVLAEGLGLGEALPVLVGEAPAAGSLEGAVARAGLLIACRLLAVTLGPGALLAAAVDGLWVSLAYRGRKVDLETGKGPTPEPVGSTGGGL